jgi:glycosyltransferase involved in cell wall biosynthesis
MEDAMTFPRISVVMPSFNQGRFIEESLQSIFDQNYPSLELIIMDGGSTDNTNAILEKYAHRFAYWTSEPDGGQTQALRNGFARATGEIECWLNSDDLLEPGVLFEVANYFAKHPEADAVFGDATWISDKGESLRVQREMPFNRFIWIYTYDYIPGMSMFWRRSLYEKVGGLDTNFRLAMDADLFIRFADVGRIDHVSRLWSRMRFYAAQKNQRLRTVSDAEDLKIRARYWGCEHPPFYVAKKMLAQAIRIGWRFSLGAYYPGYRRDLAAQVRERTIQPSRKQRGEAA